jgi:predicted MPP superfamily phosphohydrolase
MRRLIITCSLFLIIIGINIYAGQSLSIKSSYWNYPDNRLEGDTLNIDHIRFGSSGNPLNGLTITWSSMGTADKISWGYTTDFEQGEHDGLKREINGRVLFDYTFPVLSANSIIHYSLFDSKDSIWIKEKIFKTATDTSNDQFSFTVFGDSRSYPEEWKIISEATLETDFTLFLGDIVYSGTNLADWDNWFKYGEKFISRETIYHTIGNHDRDSSASRYNTYLSMFTLPGNELYYSFKYGNAIFICINTLDPGDTAQYNWLKSTLNANKDKTWKFIFTHKPFFTSPKHTGELDSYLNTIWKAYDDWGVDMIFNGHTHNYQRTKPINRNVSTSLPVTNYGSGEGQGRCQIVAGSAGAPMVGPADTSYWWLERTENKRHFCDIYIDGNVLTLKAMDAFQNVFDELTIDKNLTGTNKLLNNKSLVFPNPSDGEFYIKVQPGERFSYRIFNSAGIVISEVRNSKAPADLVKVELKNHSRGMYLIELSTEKKRLTEKIFLY